MSTEFGHSLAAQELSQQLEFKAHNRAKIKRFISRFDRVAHCIENSTGSKETKVYILETVFDLQKKSAAEWPWIRDEYDRTLALNVLSVRFRETLLKIKGG